MKTGRVCVLLVLVNCAVIGLSSERLGCTQPLRKPDMELETDVSLSRCTGKVLLTIHHDSETAVDLGKLDRDIRGRLVRRGVELIEAKTFRDWVTEHPKWTKPEELAWGCGAEWIVDVSLSECRAEVVVFDCVGRKARRVYRKLIEFQDETRLPDLVCNLLVPH